MMMCKLPTLLIAGIAAVGHATAQVGAMPPTALQPPGSALAQPQSAPKANAPGLAPPPSVMGGAASHPPTPTPPTPSQMAQAIPGPGVAPATKARSKALAEILKRPDSDVITAPDGKKMTVGDIRKIVKQRERYIAEVKAGKGRKLPPSAPKITAYAPRRAQLLQMQPQIRDEENRLAAQARVAAARLPQAGVSANLPALSGPGTTLSAQPKNAILQRDANAAARVSVNNFKGIATVNNRQTGFRFTPGGSFTILGAGFGATAGQLQITGLKDFAGGTLGARIASWSDGEIQAQLPEAIRGVPDQDSVGVQVVTAAGVAYAAPGGTFIAAREEVLITSGVDRLLQLKPDPNSWVDETGALGSAGYVTRGRIGLDEEFDCPSPGQDQLLERPLSRGFTIAGMVMWHDRTDTGDGDGNGYAGSRSFFGRYELSWQIDRWYVNWGIWRSHTSPMWPIPGGGSDECISAYWLAVSVIGPAGVSPVAAPRAMRPH